jgi:hypothetical protein
MPGFNYAYANQEFKLLDKQSDTNTTSTVLFTKRADTNTALTIDKIIDTLASLGSKVIYWNECIEDGSCFILFIRDGRNIQKIYVSNYYDETIDRLVSIFDAQFKNYKPYEGNTLSYSDNKDEIESLVKSQHNCDAIADEKFRNDLFEQWTEFH